MTRIYNRGRCLTGWLILLISLCISMQGNAQDYPVQAQVQLVQPVSPQLSTLYTGTVPRMVITLLNKDLQEPSLSVKLRLTIKGTLATLRSKDYVFYRPIVLDAGVPTQLSLDDLAPYFNLNNLDVSGIPLSQLTRTGRLRDGYYTFCVEVLEARLGQVLSDPRQGCSPPAWIVTSDPPLLNLPVKGESVAFRDPLNLLFTWTPRHMGSPNAAFNTEYEFTLSELWDNGMAPEAAFSSMPPLYQTTVFTTTLLYGPAEPSLIPGKKYGWRVQAKAKLGADSYDVFNNGGYSEIFWFTFQDDCTPPIQATATIESGNIAISWLPQPKMYEYTVDYREADKPAAEWFSVKSSDTRITIYGLVPGRKYEYRVGGYCSQGNKVLGDVHGFVMPDRDVSKDMTCGLLADSKITNKTPIKTLEAGEQVMVGDFPMKILQVSGNGSFTGYGYITVSFIGYNRVKVKFDNITVNTDRQLLTGIVETTFDKFGSQIADVDSVAQGLKDLATVISDVAGNKGGNDVGSVKTGDIVPDITTQIPIDSPQNIKVDTKTGTITITDPITGKKEEIPYKDKGKELPLVIEDKDGNLYKVDKDGNVTAAGKRDKDFAGNDAALAALKNLNLENGKVIFTAGAGNKYSFDAWKDSYEGNLLLDKQFESLAGGKYRVNAKAITPGVQEEITATLQLTADNLDKSLFKFVTGKGIAVPAQPDGNTFTLKVTGGPGGDAQEIYAVYPDGKGGYMSMGKLLLVSYTPKDCKVVLVPVGAAVRVPDAAVKQALGKAYSGIGITPVLTVDESFRADESWDLNGDNSVQDTKSAFLSNAFTGEEKLLIKAYRKDHTIDKDAVYLFIVDEATLANGDLQGKMPRESQYGLIFTKGASDESIGRTAAHEIGHGAYTLDHSFGTMISLPKEGTDNLMDYGTGYSLLKYQWNVIHDPGHVWGVLEDDGDQQSVGYADIKQFEQLKNQANNTYTFITPGGTYITLPAEAKDLKFSTLDRTYFTIQGTPDGNMPAEQLLPLGSLISFQIDKLVYGAYFVGDDFKGYDAGGGNKLYEDKYTAALKPANGIAAMLGVKNGEFVTYASRFATGYNAGSVSSPYYGTSKLYDDFSVVHFDLAKDLDPLEKLLTAKKADVPLLTLTADDLRFATQEIAFNFGDSKLSTVKDMLLKLLDEKSPMKDYLTFYTVANMRANELDQYKGCLESMGWDAGFLPKLKGMGYDDEYGRKKRANEFYSGLRNQLYKEFKTLASKSNQLVTDLEAAVQAGKDQYAINKIFAANYNYCSLGDLKLDTRMYILKQLLSEGGDNNNWYTDPNWYTSNDGAFILGDLIRSTPQADRLKVLKDGFMANNYQWLRKLVTQSEKWFNGVGYENVHDIADAISPWILENYSNLGIKPTQKTLGYEYLKIDVKPFYPGETEFYLGLNTDGFKIKDASSNVETEYKLNDPAGRGGDHIIVTEDGKIDMWQSYTMKDVAKDYQPAYGSYFEKYDPFEPVTLRTTRTLLELGLNKDEKIILPAYMAYFYHRDVDRAVSERKTRTVLNYVNIGAGVLLSVETGGSSLAYAMTVVAQMSAAVSAGDLLVQEAKRGMTVEEYEKNKGYFQSWEKVVTASNTANMVVGGVSLGVGAIVKVNSFCETVGFVRAELDGVPATLTNIRTAWNIVKQMRNAEYLAQVTEGSVITLADELKRTSVVVTADDLKHMEGWLSTGKENVIYVVVHGDANGFKVMRNGVEEAFDGESLMGQILSHAKPDSKIVLLSCADIDIAKHFGKQFQHTFYCNHGYVDVAETGAIAGEHPFIEISATGATREVAISEFGTELTAAEAERLGAEKVVRLGSEVEKAAEGAGGIDYVAVKARLKSVLDKYTDEGTVEKMLGVMKANETTAKRFIDGLKNKELDEIEGIRVVVSMASGNEQTMKASIQALEKGDELLKSGYKPENLRFEHKVDKVFDVDLGIRIQPGLEEYSLAYQFKTNTETLSSNIIGRATSQLFRAPANKRIAEFRLIESDNLASIEMNESVMEKFRHDLFEKSQKPPNTVTIDEIHLVFSNGEKVKVIWNGKKIEFVKF